MDSHGRIDDNNDNNNRTTKTIAAAIPMAGVLIAAAFLSGLLSLIDSYPTAIAQLAARPPLLNITGIDPNTATGGDGGGAQSSSACVPTQMGGAGGETTPGGTTAATNATSTSTAGLGAGVNQSTISEVRLHVEEACMALQTGDTQGALVHLDLALNALAGGGIRGDNMISTPSGTTETTTTGGS
jgi:hypothetical protein